jgi:hypothetical protein
VIPTYEECTPPQPAVPEETEDDEGQDAAEGGEADGEGVTNENDEGDDDEGQEEGDVHSQGSPWRIVSRTNPKQPTKRPYQRS